MALETLGEIAGLIIGRKHKKIYDLDMAEKNSKFYCGNDSLINEKGFQSEKKNRRKSFSLSLQILALVFNSIKF